MELDGNVIPFPTNYTGSPVLACLELSLRNLESLGESVFVEKIKAVMDGELQIVVEKGVKIDAHL